MATPDSSTGHQRAWQRMLSGRRLDLLNPSPDDIAVEDIAHGLARVSRWNGQTTGAHAFSVAQHSVLVEQIASALNPGWQPQWQLAALLHDAPEYVVGDLISPFKAAIGLDYKAFEQRLLEAIYRSCDLEPTLPGSVTTAIKHADRIAAFHEAIRLAGFDEQEATQFFGPAEGLPPDLASRLELISPLPARQAQHRFLDRYAELRKVIYAAL